MVHVDDPAAVHNLYAGSIAINILHHYAPDAPIARYVLSTSLSNAFHHGLHGVFGDLRLAVYRAEGAFMEIRVQRSLHEGRIGRVVGVHVILRYASDGAMLIATSVAAPGQDGQA